MKLLRKGWSVCRWGGACLCTLLLWTTWLALGALLVLQVVIAVSQELRVPNRVVRSFEDRLAVSGLRIRFDSARFDLDGRILVENLRVFSESFEEPLAVAKTVLVRLDRWSLAAGRLEPDRIALQGATLYVPPMLSPSGRAEPAASDVTAVFGLDPGYLQVEQLSGKIGALQLNIHGTTRLPPAPRRDRPLGDDALARALGLTLQAARQLAVAGGRFQGFVHPNLDVRLTPDERQLARAHVTFTADEAELDRRLLQGLENTPRLILRGLRAETIVPVRPAFPSQVALTLRLDEIRGPDGLALDDLKAAARIKLTSASPLQAAASTLLLTSPLATYRGVGAEGLSLELDPQAWPTVDLSLSTRVAGESWAARGRVQVAEKTGDVTLRGRVGRPVIDLVSARSGRDVSALLTLESAADVDARVHLEPGWKPGEARAEVSVGPAVARNVALDSARASIRYTGSELDVTNIHLTQGESAARGRYTMDTKTLDYRILLAGQLRPAGISGWFGPWWARFWENFNFDAAVPAADVDVKGRWRDASGAAVFVSVDAASPEIVTVPFDRVRTRLFIRPDFYDALELIAERGTGLARGGFTRMSEPGDRDYRTLDFHVHSTLDLHESARIFGKPGLEIVSPFRFQSPPTLTLSGRLIGPEAPGGRHESVDIAVESQGPFTFFDFPLADVVATARLRDDEIDLPALRMSFAGGGVTGRANIRGRGDERILAFDGALKDANLGQAIRVLEEYGALRRGEQAPPQSRFQQRVASGSLDLKATAKGSYEDPYSYVGEGTAAVRGASLAEVNLLGALSQALRGNSLLGFTSWSLDTGEAAFTIERERLNFTDLVITGPSAKLEGRGHYALDAKAINFNAKFYPFDQGKTLLASAVDLVLTPLSTALELKLSGSLDNPKWYFAYGPTGLLRKLAGTDDQAVPSPADAGDKPRTPPLMLRR